MKILSVHFQSHDTSVALVEKGKILYAAANERFSRIKMDRKVPLKVLANCLSYTRTKPEDIDKVVFTGDPFPWSYINMVKEKSKPLFSSRGRYLLWLKKPIPIIKQLLIATGVPSLIYRILIPEARIKKFISGYRNKYFYDHHHMAHLHAAYYTSGWEKCLVMCVEGSGFDETFSIFSVHDGNWKKLVQARFPDSAGKFYDFVTAILGFNKDRHAGKITGLAGYGNYRKLYNYVKDFLWVDGVKLKFNFSRYLKAMAFYNENKKIPKEIEKNRREDVAAAFQKRLEECITEIVKKAVKKTGENKLAIAGGVAANVKLNQRLHELFGIDKIHIHQAMGDDGLALGAALHVAHINNEKVSQPQTVYFGPDFSDKDIEKMLKKYKLKYKKFKDIEIKVAKLLADKKIVGRFNGRMEYGPRALGNRSILYEAKDKSVNDWLNKRLKRTEFMPFAPVTLGEYANKCYENLKGAEYSSRFMTITFNCTDYMKKMSPACVHVDGTARPQILRKEDNPSYYKILKEYHRITGIPSLVNTSFNMHEEPIVCIPDDAIRAFLSSGIDYLAIGPFLVAIKDNREIYMRFGKNIEKVK